MVAVKKAVPKKIKEKFEDVQTMSNNQTKKTDKTEVIKTMNMKCKKCNRELDFADDVLKDFIACPFCGAFIEKELPPIAEGSVDAELKKLADDFGGLEIFNEENANRLRKALMLWEAPFDVARDKLLLACIKGIPVKLYEARELPAKEQQRIADSCLASFKGFSLPEDVAMEIVNWLCRVMELKANCCIKIIGPDFGSFTDDRDGKTYKTVKIGSQVWMAENCCYHTDASRFYENDEATYQKYGCLYNFDEAKECTLSGWRLPSRKDFNILENYIAIEKNISKDQVGTELKSKEGWNVSDGIPAGTDSFGFNALASGLFDHYLETFESINCSCRFIIEEGLFIRLHFASTCFSEMNELKGAKGRYFGSVRLIKDDK